MRCPITSCALAALFFALPTQAQETPKAQDAPKAAAKDASAPKLTGASAVGERAETRILVYSEDFSVFAMASLTHGQPVWKDSYDGMIDKLKGKINRLGKDWFTTLITSSELEIGGVKIEPGSYVVGLHCDNDGKFSLALLDSTKAMKDHITPFDPNWKPQYSIPMTLNKGGAASSVEKLTITFEAEKGGSGKGTLTLAWGKHTLTAPTTLHAPKK
jgi:hypothetical protein